MTPTIFASYADPAQAEKAMGALLDHGLKPSELSLLAHENYVQLRVDEVALSSRLAPATPEDYERMESEVIDNETTGTSYGHAAVDSTGRSTVRPEGTWEEESGSFAGAELAGGDPPVDPASHYFDAADKDAPPPVGTAYHTERVDDGIDAVEAQQMRKKAISGITTTTSEDAGSGALSGAAVGLGVGVLAALASVFIPGIGLVVGGGAMAAMIAGTIGAAGAGAIAGGVVGYLKDQGMPDDVITYYRDTYVKGGAILAVHLPDGMERVGVEAILAKYGATNIDLYGEAR